MSDIANTYRLYCDPNVAASMKVSAAFHYKSVDLELIKPNTSALRNIVYKHTKSYDRPLMLTPSDNSLSSSALMLNELDNNYQEFSFYPDTPVQRFLCEFIELYADHFLELALALADKSSSFSTARNSQNGESADPRFYALQDKYKKQFKTSLLASGNQTTFYISHIKTILSSLNKHFHYQDYLFGNRPSAADFALYAQISVFDGISPINSISWGNLLEWQQRLCVQTPLGGEWLLDDYVPDTLWDFFSYLDKSPTEFFSANQKAFDKWAERLRADVSLPDFIGEHRLHMGGGELDVSTNTDLVWRLNRLGVIWRMGMKKDYFAQALKEKNISRLLEESGIYQIHVEQDQSLRLITQ